MISIVVVVHGDRGVFRALGNGHGCVSINKIRGVNYYIAHFGLELNILIGHDILSALIAIIEVADSRNGTTIRESRIRMCRKMMAHIVANKVGRLFVS